MDPDALMNCWKVREVIAYSLFILHTTNAHTCIDSWIHISLTCFLHNYCIDPTEKICGCILSQYYYEQYACMIPRLALMFIFSINCNKQKLFPKQTQYSSSSIAVKLGWVLFCYKHPYRSLGYKLLWNLNRRAVV